MSGPPERGAITFDHGRFALLAALGTTPTGGVFLANDKQVGERCAIKLLDRAATNEQSAERFLAEARVLSVVSHPHVLHARAHGCEQGFCWYAMDLLPASLRDHARRRGPMPPTLAIAAMVQVLCGLHEVHQQGMVHRDIKLTNVLVDEHGRLRVADFGIAHHPEGTVPFETVPGQALGTPGYGAPEQWGGDYPVGPRADLFATGVLMYRLMTGRRPERLHMAHYREHLLDDLPEAIRPALLRATEVDPGRRFVHAAAMIDSLCEAHRALTDTDEALSWVGALHDPTAVRGPTWGALATWFR
jgi:serine/threonine protein kinase